mmetsp:Transcript_82488/g.163794  ORF Transcript_82488/g.163794 Transcript_82488/m.163794 type:complete len:234 (-) Transcript_82488:863-1564(-)
MFPHSLQLVLPHVCFLLQEAKADGVTLNAFTSIKGLLAGNGPQKCALSCSVRSNNTNFDAPPESERHRIEYCITVAPPDSGVTQRDQTKFDEGTLRPLALADFRRLQTARSKVWSALVSRDDGLCLALHLEVALDLVLVFCASTLWSSIHPLLRSSKLNFCIVCSIRPYLEALCPSFKEYIPAPWVRKGLTQSVDFQDLVAHCIQEVPVMRHKNHTCVLQGLQRVLQPLTPLD